MLAWTCWWVDGFLSPGWPISSVRTSSPPLIPARKLGSTSRDLYLVQWQSPCVITPGLPGTKLRDPWALPGAPQAGTHPLSKLADKWDGLVVPTELETLLFRIRKTVAGMNTLLTISFCNVLLLKYKKLSVFTGSLQVTSVTNTSRRSLIVAALMDTKRRF